MSAWMTAMGALLHAHMTTYMLMGAGRRWGCGTVQACAGSRRVRMMSGWWWWWWWLCMGQCVAVLVDGGALALKMPQG